MSELKIKAKCATPPATGETELPPLPEPDVYDGDGAMLVESTAFSAKLARQIQRDAIAHYLRKQAGQEGGKA